MQKSPHSSAQDQVEIPQYPYIYFARRLHPGSELMDLSASGGVRNAYGLWSQLDGTTHLEQQDQAYELRPGAIALTQPGSQVRLSRGAVVLYAIFTLSLRRRHNRKGKPGLHPDDAAERPWRQAIGVDIPVLLSQPDIIQARQLLEHLVQMYWRSPLRQLECNMRLGNWLFAFAARLQEGTQADPEDGLIRRFEGLVRARLEEPVTVDDLARQLGISVNHLTRCFKAKRHKTPGQALRQARVERAQDMLRANPRRQIENVALQVGYRDATAFTRAFKALVGQSPKRWVQNPE